MRVQIVTATAILGFAMIASSAEKTGNFSYLKTEKDLTRLYTASCSNFINASCSLMLILVQPESAKQRCEIAVYDSIKSAPATLDSTGSWTVKVPTACGITTHTFSKSAYIKMTTTSSKFSKKQVEDECSPKPVEIERFDEAPGQTIHRNIPFGNCKTISLIPLQGAELGPLPGY